MRNKKIVVFQTYYNQHLSIHPSKDSHLVILPAPSAVVGGRNMLASEAANTAPSPIASGARMFRNSPEGAHTAIVLRPPTTPAVYLHSLDPF